MCVMTSLGILGLLSWGAYSAGKAVWKNRLTIVHFTINAFQIPGRMYQVVETGWKRA